MFGICFITLLGRSDAGDIYLEPSLSLLCGLLNSSATVVTTYGIVEGAGLLYPHLVNAESQLPMSIIADYFDV